MEQRLLRLAAITILLVFSGIFSCENNPEPGKTDPVKVPVAFENTVWTDSKGNKLEIAGQKAYYTDKQYEIIYGGLYGVLEYDLYEVETINGSHYLRFKTNAGAYLYVQYREVKSGSTVTNVLIENVYYNAQWLNTSWTKESGGQGSGESKEELVKATFYLNDGTQESFNEDLVKGTVLLSPQEPARDGFDFTGWFKEAGCVNQYAFNESVNENILLYAGWKEVVKNFLYYLSKQPYDYQIIGSSLQNYYVYEDNFDEEYSRHDWNYCRLWISKEELVCLSNQQDGMEPYVADFFDQEKIFYERVHFMPNAQAEKKCDVITENSTIKFQVEKEKLNSDDVYNISYIGLYNNGIPLSALLKQGVFDTMVQTRNLNKLVIEDYEWDAVSGRFAWVKVGLNSALLPAGKYVWKELVY